jgi:hypothetical protein
MSAVQAFLLFAKIVGSYRNVQTKTILGVDQLNVAVSTAELIEHRMR